jgi:hypothetical protein
MSGDIDPRDFGRLEAEVQSLQTQVTGLTEKVDALLELANQSKGGFWAGMTIASIIGGAATFLAERLLK